MCFSILNPFDCLLTAWLAVTFLTQESTNDANNNKRTHKIGEYKSFSRIHTHTQQFIYNSETLTFAFITVDRWSVCHELHCISLQVRKKIKKPWCSWVASISLANYSTNQSIHVCMHIRSNLNDVDRKERDMARQQNKKMYITGCCTQNWNFWLVSGQRDNQQIIQSLRISRD